MNRIVYGRFRKNLSSYDFQLDRNGRPFATEISFCLSATEFKRIDVIHSIIVVKHVWRHEHEPVIRAIQIQTFRFSFKEFSLSLSDVTAFKCIYKCTQFCFSSNQFNCLLHVSTKKEILHQSLQPMGETTEM